MNWGEKFHSWGVQITRDLEHVFKQLNDPTSQYFSRVHILIKCLQFVSYKVKPKSASVPRVSLRSKCKMSQLGPEIVQTMILIKPFGSSKKQHVCKWLKGKAN